MLAIVNLDEIPCLECNWDCAHEEIEVTVESDNIVESTTAKFGFYTDYFRVKMVLGPISEEPTDVKVLIKIGNIEKIVNFIKIKSKVFSLFLSTY